MRAASCRLLQMLSWRGQTCTLAFFVLVLALFAGSQQRAYAYNPAVNFLDALDYKVELDANQLLTGQARAKLAKNRPVDFSIDRIERDVSGFQVSAADVKIHVAPLRIDADRTRLDVDVKGRDVKVDSAYFHKKFTSLQVDTIYGFYDSRTDRITVHIPFATAFALMNFSDISAQDKSACMTDQQFDSSKRFEVEKPSWMPEGYSLDCQSSGPMQGRLIYSSTSMTTLDHEKAMRDDNAIVILVNDETMDGWNTDVRPPKERVATITDAISSDLKEKMQFRSITVNGYPGFAREAGNYGTLTTQYFNGIVVSNEETMEPARVEVHMKTTYYVIMAFRPADELIKVAESIPVQTTIDRTTMG